ncbi:MAG: hypothetical protein J6N32_02670, partial [Clostridia bacterium]|nr:hypothetical protein [Clostridia bacterium]
ATPAEPDFHLHYFVEIQTSVMSTGLTNFSFTNRYISKNPLSTISAKQTVSRRLKFFAQLSFRLAQQVVKAASPLHEQLALTPPHRFPFFSS